MGIKGLSVTIPHKESCLKCINVLDDDVAGIRACNTIVFDGINAFGYNTDCSAAVESLEEVIADKFSDEDVFEGREFMLLGAGGVARAIAFSLVRKKAKVIICARNAKKAEALSDWLKCDMIPWEKRGQNEPSVLINCTPVGMHPKMDESPFDVKWLEKKTIVFDTIYNPERTLLIKEAREFGCTVVTGVDMFVRQAAKHVKFFTGHDPVLEDVRYELKRATSAAKY